jgi:hypothetical protein
MSGIRIGTRSFLMKEFSAVDLGITNPVYENYSFQHRQQFFHISLIPVFPTKKFWSMREKGKLFAMDLEIPDEAYQKIINLGLDDSKTPWYSFALLIMIPVGIVLYGLSSVKDDYDSKNYMIEQNQTMNIKIDSLNTTSYILFNTMGSYYSILTKVKTQTKDSVEILYNEINNENKYERIDFDEYCYNKFKKTDSLKSVWVKKSELKEAFLKQEGIVIPKFETLGSLKLKDIKNHLGPIIDSEPIGYDYEKNIADFSITNNGFNCRFPKAEIIFADSSKITLDKTEFKNKDKIYIRFYLTEKILENYKRRVIEDIGKIECLDLENNKNIKLKLYYFNSNFHLTQNNE